MPKTITIRLKDNIYDLFKRAADGEHRTLSNFIEYAAFSYLAKESFVSDEEMKDILSDKALLNGLKKGLDDMENGRYTLAK